MKINQIILQFLVKINHLYFHKINLIIIVKIQKFMKTINNKFNFLIIFYLLNAFDF